MNSAPRSHTYIDIAIAILKRFGPQMRARDIIKIALEEGSISLEQTHFLHTCLNSEIRTKGEKHSQVTNVGYGSFAINESFEPPSKKNEITTEKNFKILQRYAMMQLKYFVALIDQIPEISLQNISSDHWKTFKSIMIEKRFLNDVANDQQLSRERIRQIFMETIQQLYANLQNASKKFKQSGKVIKELRTENAQFKFKAAYLQQLIDDPSSEGNLKAQEAEKIERDILAMPLSELDLPIRIQNLIKKDLTVNNLKIKTLGDLLSIPSSKLAVIRNIGTKTLEELQYDLKWKYGIEYK